MNSFGYITFFREPVGHETKHESAKDGREESPPIVADCKIDGGHLDAEQNTCLISTFQK